MAALGITGRFGRTNTLFDFASDSPRVVMADLLGMCPGTTAAGSKPPATGTAARPK